MDLKTAIKNQYHAAMGMLRQPIERCPDELWTSGEVPRTFWRIAYHALFYTHLYLMQREDDFIPWEHDVPDMQSLWSPPNNDIVFTKQQILELWELVDGRIDATVDGLDLDSPESGFSWYSMPKLEHELMNIRHAQQHAGQLSEILMRSGIDTDWFGSCTSPRFKAAFVSSS